MASLKQHGKHAAKIPRILLKNFVLIFRNWSSFLLLILGPLVLMFLIGMVFSSFNWTGITVGIVHESADVRSQFTEPITATGNFSTSEYQAKGECVKDLIQGSTTICIVLSDSFSKLLQNNFTIDKLPSGNVLLVYDNSKAQISEIIIGFLKNHFGLQSDQIASEGIAQLLGDLENVNEFLAESSAELDTYLTSLQEVHDSVLEFETTLAEAVSDFDKVYQQLNQTQTELARSNQSVQRQIWELDSTLSESDKKLGKIQDVIETNKDDFRESKEVIETNIGAVKTFKETYGDTLPAEAQALLGVAQLDQALTVLESDEYKQLDQELDDTLEEIKTMRSQISTYESYSGQVSSEYPKRLQEFTEIVKQAKEMNMMLHSAQDFVKQLKFFTETSLSSLGELQRTLTDMKTGFKNLRNIDAEKIISPVQIRGEPLVKSNDNVFLMFPLIVPVIMVFLSVLFSNIIMIDEIYSKAQLRNFILPVHDAYFVIGFFITNWIIVMFQMSMLFMFAQFILKLPVLTSFFHVMIISVLLSSIFILVGMIFAYLASTKENSVLISTFVTVGVLFLSDGFIPVELMNPAVALFVKLNPLVIAESAYAAVLFHGVPFSYIAVKIFTLLAFTIMLFSLLFAIVRGHRLWYHSRE